MAQIINVREANNELLVSFPFDLRDAFRAIFKTASWDSSRRAYVVKNTTANKNKLEQFKTVAASAVEALAAAEEAEASAQELGRMKEALEAAKRAAEERTVAVAEAGTELGNR
ncbi:hypothetical protein JJQ59_04865 [Cupriavidus necator]|uniref:Uncharacterized protein n=1 Tax=Cupriavidus necator TaxID=106590 RepID=A0A367PN95_CUPNE|nr:hypothetical protein [Cupriavidus necator]QQX85275.1 hypothetical protein JJQ59_04865 [Cupriavidus necator]RCJ09043.1 hypothetical protein DDK22_07270 [Cupriavidus necator]